MEISFVIPAFNESRLIARCIRSIITEAERYGFDPDEYEIIVVDNASTDDTAAVAEAAGARVVHCAEKGVTRARQAGFAASSGDFIAGLDADCEVPPGWLDHIVYLWCDAAVLISGPYRYEGFGRIKRGFELAFAYAQMAANRFVGASAMGGNFMVSREAIDKIGGFDTSIEFYGDDADFAARCSKVGTVRWLPSMWVHSSPRRFDGEGLVRVVATYIVNYLAVSLARRPVTKSYRDIRP